MRKRVLIFDDDADILEVCSIVLESSGFEVMTHNNCEEIVEKIEQFHPDVVLMDNKIPPLGGIKASQTIRASDQRGQTPIVFFSANHDVSKLATEAGANYFLEKPFELDRLVSLIEQACG